MILKASQRSGAKQLGLHLLKTEENEHVEVHEVSGFTSETLQGAMIEAYALSKGTKCKQYLFSVSLNPPVGASVGVGVFEKALAMIEERTGLSGQPRAVVFHEKEGRRHCHAVWSRIDAETMTAKPLPFFKSKLKDIARQLFIENGWQMPKGFTDSKLSVTDAARRLGVTRQALNNVVNGKSGISPEMALRLDKTFGGGAEIWLQRQMAFDLQIARAKANTSDAVPVDPSPGITMPMGLA